MQTITHNQYNTRLKINPLQPISDDLLYNLSNSHPIHNQQIHSNKHISIQQTTTNQNKIKRLFECVEEDEQVEVAATQNLQTINNQQHPNNQTIQKHQKKQQEEVQQLQTLQKKSIFDFIEEDDEPSIVDKNKLTQNKISQNQNQKGAEIQKQEACTIIFQNSIRYFPNKQIILMRHVLPLNSKADFCLTSVQRNNGTKIYSFKIGDEEICRCLNHNNRFVFQCSNGAIAQMTRDNRTFQLTTLAVLYEDSSIVKGAIRMKNRYIQNRSFSGMMVKLESISAKNIKLKQYLTKDPSINKKGKFELSIFDVKKLFKASLNNYVLLNDQQKQVCRMLKVSQNQRDVSVFSGFSPLIAFAISVAKLDWTKDVEKKQ